MRKAVGNVSTLAVSILLSCLASAGASEQVKVVPEGGLAKDWILQPGHALAAPGYPATFADRGDDVCVAIGYRVQPDGTTSDYGRLEQQQARKGARQRLLGCLLAGGRRGGLAVALRTEAGQRHGRGGHGRGNDVPWRIVHPHH